MAYLSGDILLLLCSGCAVEVGDTIAVGNQTGERALLEARDKAPSVISSYGVIM